MEASSVSSFSQSSHVQLSTDEGSMIVPAIPACMRKLHFLQRNILPRGPDLWQQRHLM